MKSTEIARVIPKDAPPLSPSEKQRVARTLAATRAEQSAESAYCWICHKPLREGICKNSQHQDLKYWGGYRPIGFFSSLKSRVGAVDDPNPDDPVEFDDDIEFYEDQAPAFRKAA